MENTTPIKHYTVLPKIIAVCGSPESGKTTASLKTAQELYYGKKGSVIYLSPDTSVPAMAFIFPHCKNSDLFSIGKALDKTDIYKEDVMKQLVSVKTMLNFGFLGYKAGENKFSYPRPTEDKITTDGRAKPYQHGEDTRSFASITFDTALLNEAVEFDINESNYELLSDEELEEYFNKQEDN